MPNAMLNVTVNSGKYTVVQNESGELYALRYGEPWRDLVGDNLVFALASELDAARAENQKLRNALMEARSLVIRHHDCEKQVQWGRPCPHCCTADGDPKAYNAVFDALGGGQ